MGEGAVCAPVVCEIPVLSLMSGAEVPKPSSFPE